MLLKNVVLKTVLQHFFVFSQTYFRYSDVLYHSFGGHQHKLPVMHILPTLPIYSIQRRLLALVKIFVRKQLHWSP